eukprot:181469-Hanusia_phi.AAC.1
MKIGLFTQYPPHGLRAQLTADSARVMRGMVNAQRKKERSDTDSACGLQHGCDRLTSSPLCKTQSGFTSAASSV